jgi:hypothetical protein
MPMDLMPPADVVAAHSSSEDLQPEMHSDDNEPDSPKSRPEDDMPYGADDAPAMPDGPVHRPLIRATLPRPEGQKDARPVPDFTVRHAPPRGNGHGNANSNSYRGDRERMRMRGGNGNAQGTANGNRGQSGPRFQCSRPAGPGRPSAGRAGGGPSGFRNGGNQGPNGKRGRGSRG